MTNEEFIEQNIIASIESSPVESVEARGFHPTDTKLRVNEEDVTFKVFNDIVMKYQNQILKAKPKILAVIKSYIAKYSSVLGLRGPTKKLYFQDSDKEFLFKAVGISRKEMYESVTSIKANDIDVKNHLIQDEFNALCVIICGTFLKNDAALLAKIKTCDVHPIDPKEKYKDNVVYFIALYLALRLYGALYVRYFKVADPNPDIMDYTIESISGKFLLKKMNNMLEFIQYHSETNVENMWDRLKRLSDVDIVYFTMNLNNRLNHAIKTIANQFYENKKAGNKITTDSANKKGEDDKPYTGDVASISADLDFAVRKVINTFYSESIIDPQLLEIACNKTKLSKSRFTLIIKKIRENRESEKRIREFFNKTISYFLTSCNGRIDEIRSRKFFIEMNKAYSVSNTLDPFVLAIKDTLDKLILENLKTIVDEGNKNLRDRVRGSIATFFFLYISTTIE